MSLSTGWGCAGFLLSWRLTTAGSMDLCTLLVHEARDVVAVVLGRRHVCRCNDRTVRLGSGVGWSVASSFYTFEGGSFRCLMVLRAACDACTGPRRIGGVGVRASLSTLAAADLEVVFVLRAPGDFVKVYVALSAGLTLCFVC